MVTPIQWRIDGDDSVLTHFEHTLTPDTSFDAFLSPAPWFTEGDTHFRLRTDVLALCFASPHVGLPLLDSSTVDEWAYRLHLLYSINDCFRHHWTPEGPTGYPIDIPTLERYVGLSFPAQPYVITPSFHLAFRRRFLSLARTTLWTPTHASRTPPP